MAPQSLSGDHEHDPLILILEEAFSDVWEVLVAHEPHRDRARDHDRKVQLSERLIVFVARGVTDLVELRKLGLKSLALPHPATWTFLNP
jgi:hypothetical protein